MFALLLAVMLGPPTTDGRLAYQQHCASCHGSDMRGGERAPSIRGVGAADVDFMVTSGRMPAAVPWVEPDHHVAQLPQTEIAAIVAYVTSVQPGGPPIPLVLANGDARHGEKLFHENCMHCHGVDARGASIGDRQWAPPLDRAPVVQIAEAIRVGPSEMPKFDEHQLATNDVDDIVTYLSSKRATSGFTGFPLRSGNPVPDGVLGWIAAGFLVLMATVLSPIRRKERKP